MMAGSAATAACDRWDQTLGDGLYDPMAMAMERERDHPIY